jgi:hypothetical protein
LNIHKETAVAVRPEILSCISQPLPKRHFLFVCVVLFELRDLGSSQVDSLGCTPYRPSEAEESGGKLLLFLSLQSCFVACFVSSSGVSVNRKNKERTKAKLRKEKE